jgi:glycerophosphoryl diester phosphodiesterase
MEGKQMNTRLWFPTLLMLVAAFGPAALASDTDGAGRTAELERRLAGPDGQVMVVAHRACWSNTSENSIEAIETCIAFGIDMVEIDVRAARDGTLCTILGEQRDVVRLQPAAAPVACIGIEALQRRQLDS